MSRRLAAVLALALATTGCIKADVGSATGVPRCAPVPGELPGGMVLMAQSVPSAQWLPCVREVPVGWTFVAFDARDGQTSLRLGSDREGTAALTVLVRPSCDLTGAAEVPSEWPELRRYERVTRVSSGYGGERHYTFAGGCVTYRFDLRGNTRAEAVAVITDALGFVSRSNVAKQLRTASDGRLRLD
ncbi:MAG: hypothetical protein ACJ73E_03700 [Mycobacteriales bacterium]